MPRQPAVSLPSIPGPWRCCNGQEIHALTDGLFHWEQLEMLDSAVHVKQRVHLTLDGIAKGYAVDRAVDALRCAGADCGVVNAGGDLRVSASSLSHLCATSALSGQAGAYRPGDGSSRRQFGGLLSAAEFFDPRTGKIVRPGYGITVIALDCTTADALTKPCLLEPNRSTALPPVSGRWRW